jgi:two-component system KDP operon response regulator KdpE
MSKSTISVVLIEDEKQIRRFVRTELEQREMTVFEATSGTEGLSAAANRKPDILIVDLGLPDMDGLDVIRRVREWADMPLIVLSARSREDEKIAAFEAGADDYLTKPFGVGELTARIHALLRRRNRVGEAGAVQARSISRNDERIHLTPVEFRLLAMLVRNAGRVLTHHQLLIEVWGPAHADDSHYLRVYMGNLRQKLEKDPAQPVYFLTETGVGYRFAGID